LLLRPAGPYDPLGAAGEFSPGACVAVHATEGGHPTVFIDPGHGGPDPGATASFQGGPIYEKTQTLAVALDMVPLLAKAGFRVVLSRTTDASVVALHPSYLNAGLYTIAGEHADLEARIDCANAAHAQLLLSIHFNSYGDPSVGGSETLYDDARPFTPQNQHFASLVQQHVLSGFAAAGWTVPDRGVTPDSAAGTPALTAQGAAYGHLLELGPAQPGWLDHPSTMPGALSESLFLTDPNEAAVITTNRGRRVLAQSLVAAIRAYFGR
jgi:N-acetylmuramoyl-L-alanine amidase